MVAAVRGQYGYRPPSLQVLGSVARVDNVEGGPEETVGGSDFAFRRNIQGGYNISRRNASVADIVPDSFRQFTRFIGAYRTGWRELRLHLGRRFLEEMRMPRAWSMDEISPSRSSVHLTPNPRTTCLTRRSRS
ncbi:hypothetical protein RAA17_16235 [Komagataeibacter rhaeticus]|nr:hypothetical protein [Komagataeibacter rhaeticus]